MQMTLRRFQKGDPVRMGQWTGTVLYVTTPRVDGPVYARVQWSDGHRATTECCDDLEFGAVRDLSQLDLEAAIAATKLEGQP
jgi:hypothetical protein